MSCVEYDEMIIHDDYDDDIDNNWWRLNDSNTIKVIFVR